VKKKTVNLNKKNKNTYLRYQNLYKKKHYSKYLCKLHIINIIQVYYYFVIYCLQFILNDNILYSIIHLPKAIKKNLSKIGTSYKYIINTYNHIGV